MLLGLAQSERERESMKYAIYKASGMTPSQARRQLGFEHMDERVKKVEEAAQSALEIKETFEEMACLQDKSILASFGMEVELSDSSEESETDVEVEYNGGDSSFRNEVKFCKEGI